MALLRIRKPNGEIVEIASLPGTKGDKGEKGEAGYTPQKGVDYWTDADKAEIKSYVDEAILGGEW